MNTIGKIYLFGSAKIVAVKTGALLHVIPDTVFELSESEINLLRATNPYTREMKESINSLFLGKVTQMFISELRSDINLKRSVGGTVWKACFKSGDQTASAHLSREDILSYHTRLVEACMEGKHGGEINVINNNIESILDALEKV